MRLWKIFAVISTGLVLGLAYSYLYQEADLSALLNRHPADALPGTQSDTRQAASLPDGKARSQVAMAEELQSPRQLPRKQAVRMRVHFQKRNERNDGATESFSSPEDVSESGGPDEEANIRKPVTLADVVEEESITRGLPVQRHKRGADWREGARDAGYSRDAADGEDAATGLLQRGSDLAQNRQGASLGSAAGEDEDDGDLDESLGHEGGDGDQDDVTAEQGSSSGKTARGSSRSRTYEEGSDEEVAAPEDQEDAEHELEEPGKGRRWSEADDDDGEEGATKEAPARLRRASVRGQGSAAAAKEGSMDRPKQVGSRVRRSLPRGSSKRKPRAGKQKAGGRTAKKRRSAAVGEDSDKAAKNITVRPALLGFNLTWGILEGEEALYKQDVASISPSALQGQTDRAPVAQLTAALANSRSRDGIVLVTWASAAYLDFLRNWIHHLTILEVENFLIGAMDNEVSEYLRQQNIPYFDMQAGMYSDMQGHLMKGTKAARMLAFNKIGVAQTLNTFGLDALLCDTDVVWLRDPSDYFSGLEEADILVATDGLGVSNTKDDDGLESPEAALRHQMSTGIVFLRHGRGARNFMDAWDSALRRNVSRTEQQAFNAVARVGVKPLKTHPDNWRVFYGMGRTVTFGILPASGFANGHSYFVQRLHDVMRVSPYAVHMSYVFGGVAAKRNRLREEQIWLDDRDYYDQKRLLTLDIHVPAIPDNFERLKNDYMVELHLKLMQHQLDQLVVGFAMAMTLNRTLVMPRLVCFCDRFWSPLERCRAPGASRTQLPFVCPLDQILRPSHFGDDPQLYGPPIAFREHSFWDNPDTPAELKDNQVEVVPAAMREWNPAKRMGNQLTIPANLSDEDLRRTLQPHDDIKVLMVRNVTGIFRGFSDMTAADGFWRRMAHISSIWCCNYDGGIPYRMVPRLTSANASL